jgi:hypothetical protein
MSYSFIVRAPDKLEARTMVAAEFDKVVQAQPIHAADRAQAMAAVGAYLDLLVDDDSMNVQVNVHGSLTWLTEAPASLISASVGVSALLTPRAAPTVVE